MLLVSFVALDADPWLADKKSALIVHANWNKQQKKTRLMRDNLWFVEDGDQRCTSGFDPLAAGCSKLCRPIAYAAPGDNRTRYKACKDMNKEDDHQV